MIPTINLADLMAPGEATLEAVRQATRESGLFYLDARPEIDGAFLAELFAVSRRFFALPQAVKEQVSISRSRSYRGYVGMGEESTNGQADLKESFEFGKETPAPATPDPPAYFQMYGGNQWPAEEHLPEFRRVIDTYSAAIERIGATVIEVLAGTLRQHGILGSDHAAFGRSLCSFARVIYYGDPGDFGPDETRLGAHTDSGMVTVSVQDCGGLEVRTATGEWLEVAPPDGACVVFTGELMELWSGGYYPACLHRVRNRALRRDRVSVITFFIPDLRSVLIPLNAAANPVLADQELTVPTSNSWLKPADGAPGAGGSVAPFVVGEREWERVHEIFDEGTASGEPEKWEERSDDDPGGDVHRGPSRGHRPAGQWRDRHAAAEGDGRADW